jgi:hypothetical protein
MIRLMLSTGRPVEPMRSLVSVPQTGDRIETMAGPMVVDRVVCETVPAPGVRGSWRIDLTAAEDNW